MVLLVGRCYLNQFFAAVPGHGRFGGGGGGLGHGRGFGGCWVSDPKRAKVRIVSNGVLLVAIVVVLLEIDASALMDCFCPVRRR